MKKVKETQSAYQKALNGLHKEVERVQESESVVKTRKEAEKVTKDAFRSIDEELQSIEHSDGKCQQEKMIKLQSALQENPRVSHAFAAQKMVKMLQLQ